MPRKLATLLLDWYALHKRQLPWRDERDPYRLWISEIMLQQTQVETVIPYYRRWLKHFPTVRALAAAPQAEVLALWEGLGYYARARNLHRAAQRIVGEHGGHLPRTLDGLRALPGIGRYTAAAIASIAFGVDAAVLDGNVKRVLARVFDVREDVKSPRGEKRLWEIAEALAPRGRAGDYNQAIMDLGATICTPRAPKCDVCPLRSPCAARKLGVQLERPVARSRAAIPHHIEVAGVIRKGNRVLIAQRPAHKLLGGLWAFPGGRRARNESLAACLRRVVRDEFGITISVGPQAQTLTHAFTHFRITLHVFDCRWRSGGVRRAAARWVHVGALGRYPMGKTDRQVAKRLLEERVK
ncbi:MAG: mutY [Anaerolineales bacterium]|nr:mutY [Anaerolineales bacterium]